MARRRRHFQGTKAEHRARTRLLADELRHDVKMLRVNLDRGECHRALKRLFLLAMTDGQFVAERSWVSRKHGGAGREIRKLKERFAKMCVR